MNLDDLQAQCWEDSLGWFPHVHHRMDPTELVVHFALGLAGEAGEVANLVKKINRGDLTLDAGREAVGDELADVLIYLCDLAEACDIRLSDAFARKHHQLVARWG